MDVNITEVIVAVLIGIMAMLGIGGLMGWNAARERQRKLDHQGAFTRAARNEADRKVLAHEHAADSAIPDDVERRIRARERADKALGHDDKSN